MSSTKSWFRAAMHPPKYFLVSLLVSLGGLLNGIDTGTIGPVTQMLYFTKQFGEVNPNLQGFVVSSIMLTAAFTSLFSGDVSDSFGRPRAIAIGGLVYAIGAALETAAMNLGMLIAGRLIVGAGEGLFLSTLIVYTTEISPPRWRGALCTMVQLFITLGLVMGFFISYGTIKIDSTLSWRLPFAIHAGFAAILFVGSCLYLPHSPRWLSHHGRRAEASKVWDDLGVSSAEREKDILETLAASSSNPSSDPSLLTGPAISSEATPPATIPTKPSFSLSTKLRDFIRIFDPSSRRATLLALFLCAMQQLSGIDGIIYYAPQLFQQAGLSGQRSNFLASGISAICIFTFTIPAVLLADKWGRRPSTIYGGLALFACMALMSILYGTNSVHGGQGAARWVVITAIYIFAIVYSMTWSIGLRIFASEIQRMETRATATSLAQGLNCLANFGVAFVTPVLLAESTYAVYVLFSGCIALAVGVSVVYMPETQGRDLETVREAFLEHKAGGLNWGKLRKTGLRMMRAVGNGVGFGRARGHVYAEGMELEVRSQSSRST